MVASAERPQTIASIYIVVFSAIHFLLICRHDNVAFVETLRDSPGAAVSFLLGCLILPSMLFLLAYHIRVRGATRQGKECNTDRVKVDDFQPDHCRAGRRFDRQGRSFLTSTRSASPLRRT